MSTELQQLNGQTKVALWAERISECRNSGLSVKTWCKEKGGHRHHHAHRKIHTDGVWGRGGVGTGVYPSAPAGGHQPHPPRNLRIQAISAMLSSKKTQYYLPEFEKAKRDEKCRFNWAGFSSTGSLLISERARNSSGAITSGRLSSMLSLFSSFQALAYWL